MASHEGSHSVHFFKVIRQSNLLDAELRVPKSFVRRYWEEISHRVILRLPNDTEWKVYWLKRDGDVWFRNGWKEFSEYLSLKESQFIVFRYKGNSSKFDVTVLGKSGLEINYPSSKEDDPHGEDGKCYESDYSVEVLDGKKRPRPSSSSLPTRKKKEKCPKEEEPERCNIHAETKHGKNKDSADFHSAKQKSRVNTEEVLDDDRIKKFHETVKNRFPSDRHFTTSLRKTYIERDLVVIPNEFVKKVLHSKEGDATLFVEHKSKKWDVKLKFIGKRQFTITGGWRRFLADNKLKIGDVCVFELIKCKQVSFKVHIYQFEEGLSTPLFEDHEGLSHKPSSSLRSHETTKANSRLMSKNYFTKHMKHASAAQYLVIPIHFIRNYIVHNGQHATLRVGERTWSVKILYNPNDSFARLSQGWSQFFKDCNLKNSDTCRFEMIDEDNFELKVSIV